MNTFLTRLSLYAAIGTLRAASVIMLVIASPLIFIFAVVDFIKGA